MVNEFCSENNISPLNTRLFKNKKGLTLKVASVETKSKSHTLKNGKILEVETGDFSYLLKKVVNNLTTAKKYASNDTEI